MNQLDNKLNMQNILDLPTDVLLLIINYLNNNTLNLFAQTSEQLIKYKKIYYTYNLNYNTTKRFCKDEHFRNQFSDSMNVNIFLSYVKLVSVDIFKNISKLTFLKCDFNYTNIDILKNLKKLYIIECTNISNINKLINIDLLFLKKCNNIIKINFKKSNIKNIHVECCDELVELKISQKTKILSLINCYKLKVDIDEFKNVDKLIMSTLSNFNKILYFTDFKFKELNLNAHSITEINLNGCDKLEHLNLNYCHILKHINITNINNITKMNLSSCKQIVNINSFLSKLKNLNYLTLHNCDINDTSGIEHVPNLDLSYCDKITNVDKLVNTKYLNLTCCYQIKNIDALIGVNTNIKNMNLIFKSTVKSNKPIYKKIIITKCFGLKSSDELFNVEKRKLKSILSYPCINKWLK